MIQFLEATNKLFENGFLSHRKISSADETTLASIRTGFSFFCHWYSTLESLPDFRPKNPREKRFLSWQTFDLLRLTVFGFLSFAKKFLEHNPNHYLIPFRINGSAVESWFAQIRQRAGCGAVSSVNYSFTAARVVSSNATDMCRRKRKKDDGYRFAQLDLKRSKH